jgi:type III secretion protein J
MNTIVKKASLTSSVKVSVKLNKAVKNFNLFLKPVLLCLMFLTLAACTTHQAIINGVEERDANEIVVLLESKGITATKQLATAAPGGGGKTTQLWNIAVDPAQTVEAMAILNAAGLPRVSGQSLLDLFSDSGLVPTEMQQKIRYQAGLAQQISNTIRQIDGVIDATVQLSFPPDDTTNQAITASVYVKHNGILDNPNSQLVTKIKQLVAGSVSGLSIDNVTVVADRARFSDVTLNQGAVATPSQDLDYVKIWSVIVEKNSVGVFRTIFFTFCIVIFILVCLLAWIIWKCYPIIHRTGGISALFKGIKPLEIPINEGSETGADSTPDNKA